MFLEHQISIFMLRSCDTEDWSNDAENSEMTFKKTAQTLIGWTVYLSVTFRRGAGLHCAAVSSVHDAPKLRPGQADQITTYAGPREPGPTC